MRADGMEGEEKRDERIGYGTAENTMGRDHPQRKRPVEYSRSTRVGIGRRLCRQIERATYQIAINQQKLVTDSINSPWQPIQRIGSSIMGVEGFYTLQDGRLACNRAMENPIGEQDAEKTASGVLVSLRGSACTAQSTRRLFARCSLAGRPFCASCMAVQRRPQLDLCDGYRGHNEFSATCYKPVLPMSSRNE